MFHVLQGCARQGLGSIPDVKLERRLGVAETAVIEKVEAAVKLWLALK